MKSHVVSIVRYCLEDSAWIAALGMERAAVSDVCAVISSSAGVSLTTARRWLYEYVTRGGSVGMFYSAPTDEYGRYVKQYLYRNCKHSRRDVVNSSTGEKFWTCRDCGASNG
jgi:hypothetical protein